MEPRYFARRSRTLALLIGVAACYSLALAWRGSITGSVRADGHLGVLVGLLICAYPSAHAVDLLFYHRQALHDLSSNWRGIGWFLLNLVALVAGWLVIVQGVKLVASFGR